MFLDDLIFNLLPVIKVDAGPLDPFIPDGSATLDQLGHSIIREDYSLEFKKLIWFMDGFLSVILDNGFFGFLFNIMLPIGVLLCVIYFALELMDKATTTNFSVETIFRQFLRLFIAIVIMTNVRELTRGIVGFAYFLCEQMLKDGIVSLDYHPAEFAARYSANVHYTIMSILNGALNFALKFYGITIGVMRAITIAVKIFISPIIVADVYNNGLNSSGIKFFRGLLADCLQTTVITILYVLCMMATTAFSENQGTGFLVGIIVTFVLVGLLPKTNSYMNQVLEGMTS